MAAKLSKLSSRKRSVLELTSMSQAEAERATSTSVQAGFGVPDLRRERRWTEMNRRCTSEFPQAWRHPQLKRRSCTLLRDTRPVADGVDGVLQCERRMNRTQGKSSRKQTKPCQELSSTQQSSGERRSKRCQHLLSTPSMTNQRAQRQHCVPRKHSVSNWHSWRFSDTMW